MSSATVTGAIPGPAPVPSRPEALALLDQLLSCSREEQRYILEQLLRNYLGDNPPKELGIYKEVGVPYAYILEPEHRIRLFVTPERLAIWAAQDPSKARPLRELNALLERGNEEEIKAYLASLNS